MKVKVFFGTIPDHLAHDIQGWLDSAGPIEIAASSQSAGKNEMTGEEGVFITVFYK
jgi:hypothetical protein